jgi:hypothetical protein
LVDVVSPNDRDTAPRGLRRKSVAEPQPKISAFGNLEPKAWKKGRRSFPWQVRVDGSMVSKGTARADDFATFIPLAQTRVGLLPPPELTDEQAERLLDLLKARTGSR